MAPFRSQSQPDHASPSDYDVVIVGGGFSGATLAAKLLRHAAPSFSVAIVEKGPSLGRGLAYGAKCSALLLNVRARNMSAFVDDPFHFLRWARMNHDPNTRPDSFLPREVFGRMSKPFLKRQESPPGLLS